MGEALAGRRRRIGGAAAVVVLALIAFGVVRALTADAGAEPAAVATVAVDRGAVTSAVATTGTVQPAQTRSLAFGVAGTVESIAVRAGTTVTPGQELAKVDDTDAAEAVADAQDSLDDAQDALAEAEENAATAGTCESDVAAGYASPSGTAGPSRSPTVAPSRTTTSTPSRTTTPTRTGRGGAPGEGGTPTAGTPTGGAPTGGAPTGGAGAGGAGAGSGPTGGAATGGASAGGAPTSGACAGGGTNSGGASGGGTNGGAGGGDTSGVQGGQPGDAILSARQRVTQATTALAKAEEALAGATIKAPIAGRIISVGGKVGSQVTAGNAFITLADVYDMQISADFPEADADRLAERQKAVVTLPGRAGQQFRATVVQVDPVGAGDGTMVRYGVLLSFDSSPKDLLVGQSAAVRVTTGSKQGVLRVPSTAVHEVTGDRGTVLRNQQRAEVAVGLRGDQYTEITEGLTEGERVARTW